MAPLGSLQAPQTEPAVHRHFEPTTAALVLPSPFGPLPPQHHALAFAPWSLPPE